MPANILGLNELAVRTVGPPWLESLPGHGRVKGIHHGLMIALVLGNEFHRIGHSFRGHVGHGQVPCIHQRGQLLGMPSGLQRRIDPKSGKAKRGPMFGALQGVHLSLLSPPQTLQGDIGFAVTHHDQDGRDALPVQSLCLVACMFEGLGNGGATPPWQAGQGFFGTHQRACGRQQGLALRAPKGDHAHTVAPCVGLLQ